MFMCDLEMKSSIFNYSICNHNSHEQLWAEAHSSRKMIEFCAQKTFIEIGAPTFIQIWNDSKLETDDRSLESGGRQRSTFALKSRQPYLKRLTLNCTGCRLTCISKGGAMVELVCEDLVTHFGWSITFDREGMIV